MNLGVPLINGVAYTHANVVFVGFGVPIIGITALDYSDPQEIVGNFSNASKMTSVGFGRVQPVASVTMTLEAIQAINNVAPAGKIQNIPFFDISVQFTNETGILIRHSLKQCRFKGRGVQTQVGNTEIVEKIDLFLADIDYVAR